MTSKTVDPEAARAGTKPSALPHVPGLDGLRGIAVLMVVTTHLMLWVWPSHLRSLLGGGFLGVELFFVLSGFLITTLLLNEHDRTGRISFRGFYRRRALRLLPALYVLLAVQLAYSVVTGVPGVSLAVEFRTLAWAVFYVSNWAVVRGHPISSDLAHLWSLAVEEQFYLVWPIITALMLAWRWSRRYALAIIVIVIAALTARTVLAWSHPFNFLTIDTLYERTDVQAVELLAGAAGGYIWVQHRLPRRAVHLLGTVSALFITWASWEHDFLDRFYFRNGGLTMIAIAAVLVVLAVMEGDWILGRAFSWGPLCAVGRVSYGVYLWHLPIFAAVHRYCASWPVAAQMALALSLTALVTFLSWRFVETPFLRRKNRRRDHAELAAR